MVSLSPFFCQQLPFSLSSFSSSLIWSGTWHHPPLSFSYLSLSLFFLRIPHLFPINHQDYNPSTHPGLSLTHTHLLPLAAWAGITASFPSSSSFLYPVDIISPMPPPLSFSCLCSLYTAALLATISLAASKRENAFALDRRQQPLTSASSNHLPAGHSPPTLHTPTHGAMNLYVLRT